MNTPISHSDFSRFLEAVTPLREVIERGIAAGTRAKDGQLVRDLADLSMAINAVSLKVGVINATRYESQPAR